MQSTQGLEPTIRPPRGLAELTFALVVVLAAVAVAAALAATPAFAAYPGQNGKFVWEKGPCPNCGLVLVDRNGSTRITAAGTFGEPGAQIVRDDQFAVISPDGEWVAFQRWERAPDFRPAGDSGLYVIRADGTGLRMLDAHTQAMSDQTRPTWSSDGTEIAYANPATGEVTIVDASGPPNPRIIPITAGGTDLYMAYVVWSPTNDVLAGFYGRGETKGVGLLPVDADAASDLTPLASTHLNDFAGYSEPSWSPDGQRVAFTHTELDAVRNVGTTRIETIKRDGTDKRALTPFPVGGSGAAAYMEHPLWSPDGEWIVWKLTAGTSAKWEGAHPDGSARSPIAVGGGEASWGPCFTACASLLPAGPDQDGDGVPDATDSCPAEAGPASNQGCPLVIADEDGDGVPDAVDSCPTQPGPVSNEGCPVAVPPLDSDGDGVPNASDSCPTQAGPASNAGCPVTVPPLDSDGDGVPNASDSCPTQAGPASNAGCPVTVPPLDSDGDGVPNASDSCPTQAGPASNAGCPVTVPPLDSDGDGVPNASDSCPTQPGPATQRRLPGHGPATRQRRRRRAECVGLLPDTGRPRQQRRLPGHGPATRQRRRRRAECVGLLPDTGRPRQQRRLPARSGRQRRPRSCDPELKPPHPCHPPGPTEVQDRSHEREHNRHPHPSDRQQVQARTPDGENRQTGKQAVPRGQRSPSRCHDQAEQTGHGASPPQREPACARDRDVAGRGPQRLEEGLPIHHQTLAPTLTVRARGPRVHDARHVPPQHEGTLAVVQQEASNPRHADHDHSCEILGHPLLVGARDGIDHTPITQ